MQESDAAEPGAVASSASAAAAVGPVEPSATGGPGSPGPPAGVRRRRRQSRARPHAVFARFSAEEFEDLAVAAALGGVTPTSYVASTAVAVARGQVRPMPSGVGARPGGVRGRSVWC